MDAIELIVVTKVLSEVGRDASDLRSTLDGNRRQRLRAYLKNGVPVMLRQEDLGGGRKADLASALAQVGEPRDMAILRELIQADIERVRRDVRRGLMGTEAD